MNHTEQNNQPARPAVSDKAKTVGLLLPVLLLCAGFLLGLCWFLRPAESETEKRELTEFPNFTIDTFLSGEFTDQVSLWYADTFPGREGLIKAYHGVQSLFGIRGEQYQQGDVGDVVPEGQMPPGPVDVVFNTFSHDLTAAETARPSFQIPAPPVVFVRSLLNLQLVS